jgi:hypothetical protein
MPAPLHSQLHDYLDHAFPGITAGGEPDPASYPHIRLELGGDLPNATGARVVQATNRALTVFHAAFGDPAAPLFVLAYEYAGPQLFEGTKDYLLQLLAAESIPPGMADETIDGETLTTYTFCLPAASPAIPAMLHAIANNEMGFDPALNQRIYFFDPATDRAFMMYDDRGCYIWSNEPAKVAPIYWQYKDWVPEYHREEIASFF